MHRKLAKDFLQKQRSACVWVRVRLGVEIYLLNLRTTSSRFPFFLLGGVSYRLVK
jgi:hypothetical protein